MVTSANTLPFAPPGGAALAPAAGLTMLRGGRASRPHRPTVECTVVHQIPGRVRLRVPSLSARSGLAEQLTRLIAGCPGVRSARANAACASLVVTFDPARVSVAQIAARVSRAAPTGAPRLLRVEGRPSRGRPQRVLVAEAGALAGLSTWAEKRHASADLGPVHRNHGGSSTMCLAQAGRLAGRPLREHLRGSVTASDVLDLAVSGARGELRAALVAAAVLIIARCARSLIARRLLAASHGSSGAPPQPLRPAPRRARPALGELSCAA